MRIRFFLIIAIVLTVVSAGTILLHSELLRRERISIMDQQIRGTALALIDSGLDGSRRVNFRRAEKIIAEELGETRFGRFFIVRNSAGNVIFESTNAKTLNMQDLPDSPQWLTMEKEGQFIRVLNLSLPSVNDRRLQVGAVVERRLLVTHLLSSRNLFFICVTAGSGLLIAWVLASTLLQPIRSLARFVDQTATDAVVSGRLPPVPKELRAKAGSARADEFYQLVSGLDAMIAKLNRNHKLSRIWTYQMAHELKTPLAILEVEMEKLAQSGAASPVVAESMGAERQHLSEIINSFLDWAELESSEQNQQLHATKLSRIVTDVVVRLERRFPGRFQLQTIEDFYVVARRSHLEQALQNLILNAALYSPADHPVLIRVEAPSLFVTDRGPGIPATVLERLGEPFNRGSGREHRHVKGHGLGLAWVSSLTRLYGWNLNFESLPSGTVAKLTFPVEKEQSDDAVEPQSQV